MAKNKRGGTREGAGRKHLTGTKPQMKSVKLSREHWEKAREIGDGNMAQGIRLALDSYRREGKQMNKPCLFKPGDKVQLLHQGRPTGRIAVVREVQEDTGCLLADFVDKLPGEFPVYDNQSQFVLAD